MAIDEREFLMRVEEAKDASIARHLSITEQAVHAWDKAGVPKPRIPDLLAALGIGMHDVEKHVVMSKERAEALELLAAEALSKGRR